MRSHRGQLRPVGVRCLRCGSDSKGPARNAAWRAHPATGEQWVCTPCFYQEQRRRCLECGADGAHGEAKWRRHPATREQWVCQRCYLRVRAQLKRLQGQAGEAGKGSGGEAKQPEKARRG